MNECTECGAICRTGEHYENEGLLPIGTCGDCKYFDSSKSTNKGWGKCQILFATGDIDWLDSDSIEFFGYFGCIHWEKKND